MSRQSPQSLYLDVDGTPVFSVIHRPAGTGGDTAVIFCPPFGWEEVCAYRILREWASRLADAGFPALRVTLPGCGDSGGRPRDPDRLTAWTASVTAAAHAVRAQTGAVTVVAVGLGLGGLLAYRAAAAGAPIDGLVLWATPARGRELTRQLKAFARLEASQVFEGLPSPPPPPEGELEAGGFTLSASTQAELAAVDLSDVELGIGLAGGALLLERDGIAVDERLREALERHGVTVSTGAGDGYGEMTSHPQQTQVPEQVVADVLTWLRAGSPAAAQAHPPTPGPAARAQGRPPAVEPGVSRTAVLHCDGAEIVETPVQIAQSFGNLSGILTTPREAGEALCVVMLNAGAIRRIGPNRMWVEAARRWAARGVPSLRLDVEGIGEADGAVSPYAEDNGLYGPELVPQVMAAIEYLARRGIAERFVLAGLCGGAYWSLYAGLDDPRVSAALMLNSRAIVWDTGLAPSRDLHRLFSQRLSWARLRHNVTGPRLKAVVRWLLGIPARRLRRGRGEAGGGSLDDQIAAILQRLHDSPLRALFLFSAAEPLEEELLRTGWLPKLEQWPNVTVTRIAVRDHTLRPLMAQQQAHGALDRALTAELELMSAPAAAPAP
jgi:pimeloyl-ACP methyl ester carboxylesterase